MSKFINWRRESTELHHRVLPNRQRLKAEASGSAGDDQAGPFHVYRPKQKSVRRLAERVRAHVALRDIVSSYTRLKPDGERLVGHCPFHSDPARSFSVYPASNTYACSACGAKGDVITFVMKKESMTFRQALEALARFEITHELYGTS